MENVPGIHRGFDVCIEAAGEEECMQIGIKLCKPNGTCNFWEARESRRNMLMRGRCSGGHVPWTAPEDSND
jgi:hypothetical protein